MLFSMDMEIAIKKVRPEEVEDLRRISIRTFEETFAADNPAEDMADYLRTSFSSEKLSGELRHPQSEFYFAQQGSHIIGYLKINTGDAQTEPQPETSVEIERIYVAKEYHGMKIGQHLLQKALERASELQADHVWLGVWERNERAIRFYQQNGFEVFGEHQFRLGSDLQTDLLMRKNLSEQNAFTTK